MGKVSFPVFYLVKFRVWKTSCALVGTHTAGNCPTFPIKFLFHAHKCWKKRRQPRTYVWFAETLTANTTSWWPDCYCWNNVFANISTRSLLKERFYSKRGFFLVRGLNSYCNKWKHSYVRLHSWGAPWIDPTSCQAKTGSSEQDNAFVLIVLTSSPDRTLN